MLINWPKWEEKLLLFTRNGLWTVVNGGSQMKSYLKTIFAAGLSAIVVAGAIVPAQAMPLPVAPQSVPTASNDVVNVQYYRDRYERRGWYNGHRGYRYERRGYRRHSDGWWYPLAAFGAGAIIGGAIANDGYARPRYEGINPRHIEWCYARYRSYRDYDNTFQPNYGGRRQCYSPYY